MTEDRRGDDNAAADPAPQPRRVWQGPFRSVVYPLLVVSAIVAAIWWLEYRPDSGSSSDGGRYGVVEMPAALVPAGTGVEAAEGKLAPDFLLEALDGPDVQLSDIRGKGVIVNLWASWCSPCRKEMPQFVAAYDRYRSRGLEIVAVNVQESASVIQPFVDDFGMTFPVALDRTGRVSDKYRILGLPTTYFIDRDGVIRTVFRGPFLEQLAGTNVQGAIEQDELTQRIEEILE
jgi:peroxiredoxin